MTNLIVLQSARAIIRDTGGAKATVHGAPERMTRESLAECAAANGVTLLVPFEDGAATCKFVGPEAADIVLEFLS